MAIFTVTFELVTIPSHPIAPDGPANVDKTEGEEEVDFGYWESAMLEDNPSTSKSPATSSTKDIDLDLL